MKIFVIHSYFGVDPKLRFVRIICSGGISELNELMDRLEQKLKNLK